MAVTRISISEYRQLPAGTVILDVRSPGEYIRAHISGAHSLPLFSDEERKVVGTTYKQKSRELAIKAGLDFFGPKMKAIVEAAEKIIKDSGNADPVMVHCWRGGMRSAAIAWLLDLYGIKVLVLTGGYKAYRNWVLQQFESDYSFRIIGGYTGSGKSHLLKKIGEAGNTIIDLEGIANHKGSAFGGIGMPPQPMQEMFENILAEELFSKSKHTIWIEDESQRIGSLNIPHALWRTIRTKPLHFVEIPFEERLLHITNEYGDLDKANLASSISRIEKRLGPLETKTALEFLHQNNMTECFRVLLHYYDKSYKKALHNRNDLASLLNIVSHEKDINLLTDKICASVI